MVWNLVHGISTLHLATHLRAAGKGWRSVPLRSDILIAGLANDCIARQTTGTRRDKPVGVRRPAFYLVYMVG